MGNKVEGYSVLRLFFFLVAFFYVGLFIHEIFHLIFLTALGGGGVLVFNPWNFYFFNDNIWGFHVYPTKRVQPFILPLVSLLGPLAAAGAFFLASRLERDKEEKDALAVNISILLFFSVLEFVFSLGVELLSGVPVQGTTATVTRSAASFLASPEFNISATLFVGAVALLRRRRAKASTKISFEEGKQV